jgi:RHS repeat-associated protein
MLTDASGTQKVLYDYAPFGEELTTQNGRDARWGGPGSGLHFTGKEQEGYEGDYLHYFGARYYSGGLGRFTSADAPFADQNAGNPQSWNLYSYGRNNPLINRDPTGRCSKGSDGQMHDDSDGKCADVTSVTVTEKAPQVRDLQAEAQAELYRREYDKLQQNRQRRQDVPLSPSGQQQMKAIGNAMPEVCSGGVFGYSGTEVGSVFRGDIEDWDTQSGHSKGTLTEITGGELAHLGGGVIQHGGETALKGEWILFGGAGADIPFVASGSVGVVGFPSGVGVYGEGFLFTQGGGVGAYVNVGTHGGCKKRR